VSSLHTKGLLEGSSPGSCPDLASQASLTRAADLFRCQHVCATGVGLLPPPLKKQRPKCREIALATVSRAAGDRGF